MLWMNWSWSKIVWLTTLLSDLPRCCPQPPRLQREALQCITISRDRDSPVSCLVSLRLNFKASFYFLGSWREPRGKLVSRVETQVTRAIKCRVLAVMTLISWNNQSKWIIICKNCNHMPCTKLSLVYLYHCFNTRQSENKKNFNSVQFRFKLKFFFRVRRLCPNFQSHRYYRW